MGLLFPGKLRAFVAKSDSGIEAQLMELDIVVRGDSANHLLAELQHAIIASYHIARTVDETPFLKLLRDVPNEQKWDDGLQVGVFDLPEKIAESLAAALHIRKPMRKVMVVETECKYEEKISSSSEYSGER